MVELYVWNNEGGEGYGIKIQCNMQNATYKKFDFEVPLQ